MKIEKLDDFVKLIPDEMESILKKVRLLYWELGKRSFYDKNFKGLQNNASLVISKDSYSLIKRPVEMNSLSCVCEAFTEDIQPTFLVIQDNKGSYVYGCLAGIPLLNENNQTEINRFMLRWLMNWPNDRAQSEWGYIWLVVSH